jgi:hypothetical protein
MIRGMDYIFGQPRCHRKTPSVYLWCTLGDTVQEQPEDDDEYIENGVTKSQPNCLPMKPAKRRKECTIYRVSTAT